MASLVLGVAGAAIGSFFGPLGASIGFAIGAGLGNALFPPSQPKPIHDLHLQSGSYAAFIKLIWGTVRISGNVVWQPDATEHEQSGGKGKDGPSTSTVAQSFRVVLCETQVVKVKRIWAGGRLNYDVNQSGTFPFVLYDGEATQLPDPTEEAVEGVGNTPAYRGVSSCVVSDLDLTPFGNAMPQLSWEVTTKGGAGLVRLSTWDPPIDPVSTPWSGFAIHCVSFLDGIITIGVYAETVQSSPSQSHYTYTEHTYDLDGNELSVGPTLTITNQPSSDPVGLGNNSMLLIPCANAQIAFGHLGGQGGGNAYASSWYVKDQIVAWPVHPAVGNESFFAVIAPFQPYYREAPDPFNSAIYVIGGPGASGLWVARYPAPNGIPSGSSDAYYLFDLADAGGFQVTVGDDNCVYVLGLSNLLSRSSFTKLDLDLNLIHAWTYTETPEEFGAVYQFTVHEGKIILGTINDDPLTVGSELAYAEWTINADYTFTKVTSIPMISGHAGPTSGDRLGYPVVYLGGCYAITNDGIISVCADEGPTYLWEIVGDLCERAGLDASQYNVTELTDVVRGFVIEQQTTVRQAIEMLMPVYFFAGVESDGVIKFVKLGKDPIVSIPDDDLAAHMDGDGLPALMTCIHTQDVDLPSLINVLYLDVDTDYQINTQPEQRMVGGSKTVTSIQIPVVLTRGEAKQIVGRWMYQAWLERDQYTIQTSREYAYVEPTDVVTVGGIDLRITKKDEGATGVIKFEGVPSRAGVYIQNGVGGEAPPPNQVITRAQATQLLMLDIPLPDDRFAGTNGPFAAMAGATRPTFAGAALMESTDGGTNYSRVLLSGTRQTIGETTTALGDFTGSNIFDETNTVTVQIGNGGGTLAGYTEAEVLNGSGLYLIGTEEVGAKNADLIATDTYLLSGLLRGRRGTEWATSTHTVGERFVNLGNVLDTHGAFGEIGVTEYYKAVTVGRLVSSATAVPFANLATALKPYSPTNLNGGCDASGNVTLNWLRRTRIGGGGRFTGLKPLSEATESYVVQIWDASYALCARIISVTSETASYTSAQQVTDFGANQQTIYWTVGQIGAVSIGAQSRGTALGTGGSNTLPLAPITPFSFNPVITPPPPPGGTLPVDHIFTWPSDPTILVTLVVGHTWVGQFTTGGSPPVTGTIAVAEAAGAGEQRHCWVASDSGGLNKIAGTESWGATATSFIGGRLAASTTYYWLTDFIMPDGSLSDTAGLNAPSLISLGNVT